jgi:hypothetical protein
MPRISEAVEETLGPVAAGFERKSEQLESKVIGKISTMRSRHEEGAFCVHIILRYRIADRAPCVL